MDSEEGGAKDSATAGRGSTNTLPLLSTLAETAVSVPLVRAGLRVGDLSVTLQLDPVEEGDGEGFASWAGADSKLAAAQAGSLC